MISLLAIDPVLKGDLLWTPLLIVVLKVLVVFVTGLVATMLMVWFERKVVAGMGNRIGPNKAGPFGLLQTLADGIKLFFKEDLVPDRADPFVFKIAPFLAFVPAFLSFSIIPLGGDFRGDNGGLVTWFGHTTRVQLADPSIGVLFTLAISAIAVYGIMLAGWSSGSKYPLLGSVRASAQMVSYEAALGLSLAAVILVSKTMSTSGIVTELNRPPFDLVEAEQELVGGFNTEYSSIRFSLFYLAEFMNTVTMSALMVTLFFGGPQPIAFGSTVLDIPLIPNALEGTLWLFLKTLVFLYTYVWLRATLPRFRYDQLMDFGWKILIPSSLGWFMLLAAQRLGRNEGWNIVVVTGASVLVLIVCYALLQRSFTVSSKQREAEGSMF